MRRMVPTILRFETDVPDCAEIRYCLRQASILLAAAYVDPTAPPPVLRRARAWILAGLCGIDQLLAAVDPPVPEAISDRDTDAHDMSWLAIPSLSPPQKDLS